MKRSSIFILMFATVGGLTLAALFSTGCARMKTRAVHAAKVAASTPHGTACPQSKHAPFITSQPMDTAADAGQQATFEVVAEGKNLSYQWHARKRLSTQFEPLPDQTNSTLAFTVSRNDYGLYYCAVASDDDRGYLVTTRIATLGGSPGLGGGPFVPIDNPVSAGTVTSICGHSVSGHWDQFPGTEVPPSGETGVQCQLVNISVQPNVVLSNTNYYLQYWVTAVNTGCCTNVPASGTTVGCKVTAGLSYKFIAHFINPPADGTVLELQGTWCP